MFVSAYLGSATFTEEPGCLGGFQVYSLEDLEPVWLEAPAAVGEAAGFFCSEEPVFAPAEPGPEAELAGEELPADELPELAAAVVESPELDFEAAGAAEFLPLESFT